MNETKEEREGYSIVGPRLFANFPNFKFAKIRLISIRGQNREYGGHLNISERA